MTPTRMIKAVLGGVCALFALVQLGKLLTMFSPGGGASSPTPTSYMLGVIAGTIIFSVLAFMLLKGAFGKTKV